MRQAKPIRRLVGVYQAEGGVVGHLKYAWGVIRGTAHCALCDTTHGGVRMKASFKACTTRLGLPFDLLYLADRDDTLLAFTEGQTPCVVGELAEGGLVMLLGPEALASLGGDVEAFEARLVEAIAHANGEPADADTDTDTDTDTDSAPAATLDRRLPRIYSVHTTRARSAMEDRHGDRQDAVATRQQPCADSGPRPHGAPWRVG